MTDAPNLSTGPAPMNLRQVAQTAAVLGWFGIHAKTADDSHSASLVTEYWKCSRVLFRNWTKRLERLYTHPQNLHSLTIFAEEILVSELLTRVMAAKTLLIFEHQKRGEVAKIAFKTMREHDQCRQRVLEMIESDFKGVSTLLRCQRLERKIQRWSDLIISPLTNSEAAIHASFDPERCLDFGDEWNSREEVSNRQLAFQIQFAALSMFIPNHQLQEPLNQRLHQSRCESALAFVKVETFSARHGFQFSQKNAQCSEIERNFPFVFGTN